MDMKKCRVEVQPDFIERQTDASPVQAVAELVWNGLDADAENIDIQFEVDELGTQTLVVRDDGNGMLYADALASFTRLGGSWKDVQRSTPRKGRIVHGRNGKGRLKVFAIGQCAEWRVRYRRDSGDLIEYGITVLKDSIEKVQISSERVINSGHTGVEARISELNKEYDALKADAMIEDFNEMFVLYLNNYRDVSITFDGHQITPHSQTITTRIQNLETILINNCKHEVVLEIVEWKRTSKQALYLCTNQGIPLMEVPTSVRIENHSFSAYLKSSYIESLHNEKHLNPAYSDSILSDRIDESIRLIKSQFLDVLDHTAHPLSKVNQWKSEKIYPYKGVSKSELEDVQRRVFDIVAATTNDSVPDFQSSTPAKKAFDFRMLRAVVEKNSGNMQSILNEVLELPIAKQKELDRLSRETSICSIISAASTVTHRLNILAELEEILFDNETTERLKERSQLYKILGDNMWIIGDEFMLSASDISLTDVLRKHQNLLCDTTVIDGFVEHPSTTSGILNSMFSRALRRNRAGSLQNLVIELKRPRVRIGKDDVAQLEEFAFTVMRDERVISGNSVWEFWVISDDIDEFVEYLMLEDEQVQGTIYRKRNCVIKVKRWAQVLEDNEVRLQFFQEKLKCSPEFEFSLKYIRSKYAELMTGVGPSTERNGASVR